jgi:hypothetical protein
MIECCFNRTRYLVDYSTMYKIAQSELGNRSCSESKQIYNFLYLVLEK